MKTLAWLFGIFGLRFFRLRAKDRYDRRRHTEYAGYRQIFLRGDERKRDGMYDRKIRKKW